MKKILLHERIILTLSIVILLAGSINSQVNSKTPRQIDTLKYKTNPNYIIQLEMYDLYVTQQADIIMLGNSLTAGANWNELLGRANVVGRGIPGDVLSGIYARMDYIFRLKPKIVFVLGGLNDIYNWTPLNEVFLTYVKIINALQEQNIIPVIQSTIYAGRDWAKNWGGTPETNAGRNKEIDNLNKLLFEYAKKNNIDYLDLNSKMCTKNNYLRPELTWDGVHLNAEGYRIWVLEVEFILTKYNF